MLALYSNPDSASRRLLTPPSLPYVWNRLSTVHDSHKQGFTTDRRCQGSEITRQKSRIAKFALDIVEQSTTIWLWINWVRPLRLCLIRPGGR